MQSALHFSFSWFTVWIWSVIEYLLMNPACSYGWFSSNVFSSHIISTFMGVFPFHFYVQFDVAHNHSVVTCNVDLVDSVFALSKINTKTTGSMYLSIIDSSGNQLCHTQADIWLQSKKQNGNVETKILKYDCVCSMFSLSLDYLQGLGKHAEFYVFTQ